MGKAHQPSAFTSRVGGLASRLMTACGVCEAFDPKNTNGKPHPEVKNFTALWDTGATTSVISPNVATALGLTPITFSQIHHANGSSTVPVHYVNILLPNRIGVPVLKVTECALNGADVLIGMDIIKRGDFAITHKDGNTVFSFQTPSTHEYDFVKQLSHVTPSPQNRRKKKS